MKTAVSLPDELFRTAELAARRLKISRSQLYATAISEFLEDRDSRIITERLNKVYSMQLARLDPALQASQLSLLRKEEW